MDKKERLEGVFRYLIGTNYIRSKKDLACFLEITATSLSSAFNGDERYLTQNFMQRIHDKFPEINLEWLLTGEGEMIRTATTYIHGNGNVGNGTNNQVTTATDTHENELLKANIADLKAYIADLKANISDLRQHIDTLTKKQQKML